MVWSPDSYFNGGRPVLRAGTIAGTTDPGLYLGERFGNFSYAIPVSSGKYTVRLYFSDGYWGAEPSSSPGEGKRVFDVYCNGATLLRDFDVLKEAGGARRGLVETFHGLEPNGAGQLVFTFVPRENYAEVNAIEVLDESR